MTGSQGRGPRLTALGMQDDATGKILAAQFFPSETAFGYLSLLRQLLRRHGMPLAFYGDRSGIFVRNDDFWTRSKNSWPASVSTTQFGRALEQLGITFIAARSPTSQRPRRTSWGVFQDRLTSELRLARCLPICDSANASPAAHSSPTTTVASPADGATKPISLGVRHLKISTASAASFMSASSGNDNIVQWEGLRFQIPQQARRFSFAGAKVQHLSSS